MILVRAQKEEPGNERGYYNINVPKAMNKLQTPLPEQDEQYTPNKGKKEKSNKKQNHTNIIYMY